MSKVKVTCLILAVVLVMSGAVLVIVNTNSQAGVITPPPSDTDSLVMDKPTSGDPSTVDPKQSLYIANGELKRFGGFRGNAYGTSTSMGITQEVASSRVVVNGNAFKQSVSIGMVKMATQVYLYNSSYLIRSGKPSNISNIKWDNTARSVSEVTYGEIYGYRCSGMTGYILNDETISGGTLEKQENGIYTFRYSLDTEKAPYYVLFEMRTNSGFDGFPKFNKAEIVVEMDSDWKILSLTTDCSYQVGVPVLGDVTCTENIKEVFSDWGYNGDLDEKEFFEPFLNADVEEPAPAEIKTLNVLLDVLNSAMTNGRLYADVNVAYRGESLLSCAVSANIDIANTENIALDVKIGEDLFVAYEKGKIYVTYKEFKGSVALENAMGLVSSLAGTLGSFEFDVDSLTESMSHKFENGKCEILIPINLGETSIDAKIFADVNSDGTYKFTGAEASFGDIKAEISPSDVWQAPERSGEYPEILGILDAVKDGTINASLNVSGYTADISYNIANSSLVAELQDLVAVMTNNVAYVSLGDIKLKVSLSDVEKLLELVSTYFELNMPKLPKMKISDVFALLSDIETVKTESGVKFKLGVSNVTAELNLKDCNGFWNVTDADIIFGETKLNVSVTDNILAVPEINEADYVDVTELAEEFLPAIASVVKAENRLVGFGLFVNSGENNIGVYGSVLIDGAKNVSVHTNVSVNGTEYVFADVVFANGTLYLEANGIKTAFKVPQGKLDAETVKNVLEKICAGNAELEALSGKILQAVGCFENFDLSDLDIEAIISGFSYSNGRLNLGVCADLFGLGSADISLFVDGGKLSAEISSLQLGSVTAEISADVSPADGAVEVPNAEDYVLNIQGGISSLNASFNLSADFVNSDIWGNIEVYGNKLDLRILNGRAYVKAGNIALSSNINDLSALVGEVLSESGITLGKGFDFDLSSVLKSIEFDMESQTPNVSLSVAGVSLKLLLDASYRFDKITAEWNGHVVYAELGCEPAEKINTNSSFTELNDVAKALLKTYSQFKNVKEEGITADAKLSLDFGGVIYDVDARIKYCGGLYVGASVSSCGVKLLDGEVWFANGRLYVSANGVKLGVNVGSNGAKQTQSLADTLESFKGYNEYADVLIETVCEIVSKISNGEINYIDLVSALTFENGVLTLKIDGSQFGVSEINAVLDTNAKTSLTVSGLNVQRNGKTIGADLSVTVSAGSDAVVEPNGDFTTNIAVYIDEQNTLYANLNVLNGVYRLRIDSLDVNFTSAEKLVRVSYLDQTGSRILGQCDITAMQGYIEEIQKLIGDNAASFDFGDINVKEILSSLKLTTDKASNSAELNLTALGMDLSLKVTNEADGAKMSVSVPVELIGKTLMVTFAEEAESYFDFPENDGTNYVNIENVFGDYFDAVKPLVTTRSWHFDLAMQIDVLNDDGTATSLRVKEGSYVDFIVDQVKGEFKLRTKLTIKKVVNDAEQDYITLEAMYDGTRIFADFNGLKIAVTKTAISECADLLDQIKKAVPQVGELIESLLKAKDKISDVKFSSILNKLSYENGELCIGLNAGIIMPQLGNVEMTFSNSGNVLKLIDLSLCFDKKISLSSVNIAVTATSPQTEVLTGEFDGEPVTELVPDDDALNSVRNGILSYTDSELNPAHTLADHIDFDSLPAFLQAFLNTSERKSFFIDGTVKVTMLGKNIPIGLSVKVDRIDIDGVEKVFIAAKLVREKVSAVDLSNIVFSDRGGDSYLYYNGVSETFTVVRNSYVASGFMGLSTKMEERQYLAENIPSEEFSANVLDYIFKMINLSSMIQSEIDKQLDSAGQGTSNPEQDQMLDVIIKNISVIIKDCAYVSEETRSQDKDGNEITLKTGEFTLVSDLSPIKEGVLGDTTVKVGHGTDYDLTYLNADLKLLKDWATAKLELQLKEISLGSAKDIVCNYVNNGVWSYWK